MQVILYKPLLYRDRHWFQLTECTLESKNTEILAKSEEINGF